MKNKVVAIALLLLVAGGAGFWVFQNPQNPEPSVSRKIDAGIGPFAQTLENKISAPSNAPGGMVFIPGGTFSMGTDRAWETLCDMPGTTADATPIHRTYIDAFWMDEHEVTNAQFAAFVRATGYVTVAEKTPTKEEFPQAPAEALVAGSAVFVPARQPIPLNDHLQWWTYKQGASWQHPDGPGSRAEDNQPVVHVAWEDAVAYARWAGKCLPTEAEWEFAARGGEGGQLYSWGNELKVNNKFMCNSYQGTFPVSNTREDGFEGTAPIKQFPPNGYGLYDVAGNVWEWCSDWYDFDYYRTLSLGQTTSNPQGPARSYDPSEPGVMKKVHRGGSFLCTDQYCARYMNGTRGKGDWRTSTNHLGFRCVKDIPKQ